MFHCISPNTRVKSYARHILNHHTSAYAQMKTSRRYESSLSQHIPAAYWQIPGKRRPVPDKGRSQKSVNQIFLTLPYPVSRSLENHIIRMLLGKYQMEPKCATLFQRQFSASLSGLSFPFSTLNIYLPVYPIFR